MSKETRVKDLEKLISNASVAYYNGESEIPDDEYDALVYELTSLDPKNEILAKVGADPVTEWEKCKHLTSLGSLNKVNYPEELDKWMVESLLRRSVVVTEKLDGLSLGLQYEDGKLVKAVLRGNGIEGENIYSNVLKMKGCVTEVPNFSGTVRGEIILTKTALSKYFQGYANPRNAASGICRRFDGKGCQHLTIMCYQVIGDVDFHTEEEQFHWLKKNGFKSPFWKSCSDSKGVVEIWKEYSNSKRDQLDYDIDGLVVAASDISFQNALGETNLRAKGKMAFKFANQFVKTEIVDITWNVGGSGRVTPIAHFKPINLLGSNISKASLYNTSYISQIGADIGSEILVCKANEVIPRVEKVVKSTGKVAKHPTECPECSTPLQIEGEYLICPSSQLCPAQILGKIENWIDGLNLLEWGSTLLKRLTETKLVESIPDLYKLKVENLSSIDRMGEKSAQKCYDILWANTEIPLEVLLGSLSIPMIGSSMIKLIINAGHDSLDKIQSLSIAQLESISGLGPAKAKSLYQGLIDNKEIIGELLELGITVKQKKVGKLSGKSFIITGSFSMKRSEMEKMIEENGGLIKSSVSKDTNYLIIADINSTSSKAISAKKNGVQLIDENDFKSMLN